MTGRTDWREPAPLPERIGEIDPAVVLRELSDGGSVLFHSNRSTFAALNESSRWIWDRCRGDRTAAELVEAAVAEFGWDGSDADRAVRDVLHMFISKGMVRRSATDRLLAKSGRSFSASTMPWTWQQRFEMLDVGIVVRTNDDYVAENLRRLLAPFEVSTEPRSADLVFSAIRYEGDEGQVYDLVRFEPAADRAQLLVDGGDEEDAVMETVVATNSVCISRAEHYSLHAGAIAVGSDVTMIPAVRNTGKSTLVAACLQAGFDYVSDEAASIHADGWMVPYTKPLWLRAWSREMLDIDDSTAAWLPDTFKDAIIEAETLGGVVSKDRRDLAPVRVIELDVREDAEAELNPMTVGETVSVLVANTFDKRVRPRIVFDTCVRMAEDLDGWRLTFSHPRAAADLLWNRFGPSD